METASVPAQTTAPPLTAADESFHHQRVAPIAHTDHIDPAWAERCWHLLNLGSGWVLGAGRATWVHGGRCTAVAGVGTPELAVARRAQEPYAPGEDPDRVAVGPIVIEVVEPLRAVRLVLDDPGFADLAFDLAYTARFPPVATDRNRIERDGVAVTDYMNFFQSGAYTGVVRAGGEERRVNDRLGFRDRGWGLRKHEGAARRGMHFFCACELPDEALYVLVYENARGERALTNGWLMDATGLAARAIAVEHELHFDGRRLLDGELLVTYDDGQERRIALEAEGRLCMETVGYTAVPGRAEPGAERFDLTDPAVRDALEGLYDNGCHFRCAHESGHGFVEVGLGVHARYRPDSG
jgi:hypothetical protein